NMINYVSSIQQYPTSLIKTFRPLYIKLICFCSFFNRSSNSLHLSFVISITNHIVIGHWCYTLHIKCNAIISFPIFTSCYYNFQQSILFCQRFIAPFLYLLENYTYEKNPGVHYCPCSSNG